jgi:CheY-like chemotaxis protein
MLAAMGGAVPRRGRPRALLVHWKESEAPERLALLKAAGFDAVHRTLSTAPVRELREARPDLIVVDLGRLPSHGLAIGLAVRQSPSLRPIPLVFVGGERSKVDRVRAQLPDAAFTDWERAVRTAARALANPPDNPRPARSVMDGYSGRPLAGKLDIRDRDHVAIPGAPTDFERTLGDLPANVRVTRTPRDGADLVLWFPRDRADYERRFTRMGTLARRWLWVVWPKQSAGVRGDLDQNVVRRLGLASGYVDSKICAVDATFSALRFSRRKR